jgi:hypothetical protein
MWSKIKALPLRVKVIAVVVFVGLVGISNLFDNHHRSSSYTNSSYSSLSDSSSSLASSTSSRTESSSQVLPQLQARLSQLQNENAQCYAQVQQMNPWNYGAPPCEAKMQWNTSQMAALEAEIYRLQTGANVQAQDFALMGSSSGGGSASSAGDSSNGAGRYSREAVLGQSKYTDSNGNEYQLANQNYYFRDRASGQIVGSETSQAPDYQHDWEQLTYHPN